MYNNTVHIGDDDFQYTTTSSKTFKITDECPIISQVY